MPITSELDNLKKFESAGFNHEQAKTLADVVEKSHTESQESLKEFIENRLNEKFGSLDIRISDLDNKLSKEISDQDSKLSKEVSNLNNTMIGQDNKLSKEINNTDNKLSKEIGDLHIVISNLHAEISRELKDLLIKIFGIVAGCITVAVTILKLFP